MNCIFCKIATKEAPAKVVYENDDVIVFESIRPIAPIHLLAVPKKHIASVDAMELADVELIGKTVLAARDATREKGLGGYKLAVNVGEGGGQEIFHLHFHILGGWKNEKERDIPGMP